MVHRPDVGAAIAAAHGHARWGRFIGGLHAAIGRLACCYKAACMRRERIFSALHTIHALGLLIEGKHDRRIQFFLIGKA